MDITKHDSFYEYTIEALKQLGGSGRNAEIVDKVIQLAELSKEQIETLNCDGLKTKVDYSMARVNYFFKSLLNYFISSAPSTKFP